jgi:hypothetical protein
MRVPARVGVTGEHCDYITRRLDCRKHLQKRVMHTHTCARNTLFERKENKKQMSYSRKIPREGYFARRALRGALVKTPIARVPSWKHMHRAALCTTRRYYKVVQREVGMGLWMV